MSDWPENKAKIGRLKKRQEFLDIQHSNLSWVSSSVIVQFLPDAYQGRAPSVGYTVSKKVSSLAVDRNRIKRRLRAAVADVFPQKAQTNAAYVLIGRKETLDIPYEKLKKDLAWCLKRLHKTVEERG